MSTSNNTKPNGTDQSDHPNDSTVIDPEIEVDDDLSDSAYGDDFQSYATTLSSSTENYEWENGRRYHAFREGAYPYPNDEAEQDRLDISHAVFTQALEGKLFLAPIKNPKRILDVGTGTGIWSIDMADKFPDAEVLGNDLSPIQPKWVPPNVHFEVDDAEDRWPPRAPFDFIHSRNMCGSFKNWPRYVSSCYKQTKIGGWVELKDLDLIVYTDDNSAAPDNAMLEYHRLLDYACNKSGRMGSPGPNLKRWLDEAGFQNVHEEVKKIPLGPWAKDKKIKKLGALNMLNFIEGLEAFCLRVFTRELRWSPEQVQTFLMSVRRATKDPSTHIVINFHVAYGQRVAK